MSSRTPSSSEVVEAILSYSPQRLQHLIDQGYNLEQPLRGDAIPLFDYTDERYDEDYEPARELMIALPSVPGVSSIAYPLHVAVVCLYHAAKKGRLLGGYMIKQAAETIKVLLLSGADLEKGCGTLVLFNVTGYKWIPFNKRYPENQALHLALFLKKHSSSESNEFMDICIEMLQDTSKLYEKNQSSSLKTTAILQSVAARYRSMLFSEDFADVTFRCSDGVSVPAHRNILAASSPYFKAAFRGDWSENNCEGIWETAHSSDLIKSVLALIYTGRVEECEELLDDEGTDPLDLMDLAQEYQIEPLIHIAVDNCAKRLEVDDVPLIRMTLMNAHIHSCSKLKMACFEFILKHTTQLLMSPGMVTLAMEEPRLWAELGIFLNESDASRARKRARTDEG